MERRTPTRIGYTLATVPPPKPIEEMERSRGRAEEGLSRSHRSAEVGRTTAGLYGLRQWTTKKTIRLARELRCEEALKTAINLNRKIRLGMLETPYKIPTPKWLAMLARKFQTDCLTRATSINMLKTLTNKRTGKLLASKLTRETY